MDRRGLFVRSTVVALMATAAWCTSPTVEAAGRAEIDAKVRATLTTFYEKVPSGKELVRKAAGMLVFPEVFKAGMLVGGEYGEGALLVDDKIVDYYSIASGSIGLQLGAQIKSEVILFMTQQALNRFRQSKGWKAGVDGSIALATVGAGGKLDSETMRKPIVGFIFSNKGLMYNLTFEGSKITKLKK